MLSSDSDNSWVTPTPNTTMFRHISLLPAFKHWFHVHENTPNWSLYLPYYMDQHPQNMINWKHDLDQIPTARLDGTPNQSPPCSLTPTATGHCSCTLVCVSSSVAATTKLSRQNDTLRAFFICYVLFYNVCCYYDIYMPGISNAASSKTFAESITKYKPKQHLGRVFQHCSLTCSFTSTKLLTTKHTWCWLILLTSLWF